jgi:hypothetical protein
MTPTEGMEMEWISVKDRLPQYEDDYLTYIIDNGCSYRQQVQRFVKKPKTLKGMYGDSFTHWELTQWDDNIVTHWMPLPKPPKEK